MKPILKVQETHLRYLAGYLLYTTQQGVLSALPFDPGQLEATGKALPLLEGVDDFAVSKTGTLIVHRGNPAGEDPRVLSWFDESGKLEKLIDTPAAYGHPRLSPDGKRLALTIMAEDGSRSIWIRDLESATMVRLTFGPDASYPTWTPDGQFIFYNNGGLYDNRGAIELIRADGAGKPRRALEDSYAPESVSPDGRKLAFVRRTSATQRDIWMARLEGSGDTMRLGQAEVFLNTAADEANPAFSPDGKWFAYYSKSAEEDTTLYVRPASDAPGKWQIYTGGSTKPVWSPAGSRLFFHMRDGKVMAADYMVRGDSFAVGAVKEFASGVRIGSTPRNGNAPFFFVAQSGKRVGALFDLPDAVKGTSRAEYTLFLNFMGEIERHAARVAGQ